MQSQVFHSLYHCNKNRKKSNPFQSRNPRLQYPIRSEKILTLLSLTITRVLSTIGKDYLNRKDRKTCRALRFFCILRVNISWRIQGKCKLSSHYVNNLTIDNLPQSKFST